MNANTSGSIDALLATNTAGRFFRVLGSRPVRIIWNAPDKLLGIIAIQPDGTPGEVIVSTPIAQLERAFFTNGNYILRLNGKVYDLEIMHFKNQRPIWNDLFGLEFAGIASTYADAQSNIEDLVSLVKDTMPQNTVSAGLVSSKKYLSVLAVFAVVVVIGLVVAFALGMATS